MICNQSILFAAILGLGVFGTAATEAVEIRERDGWDLVWADEFNTPGQPDPEEWTYDRGLRRNQESQFYTDKPENCRIEDGKLILEARRERVKNPNFVPGSSNWKEAEFAEYTSACVVAKRDFLYGRLEIRAKIPAGKGTWPAFWLLGKSGYAGNGGRNAAKSIFWNISAKILRTSSTMFITKVPTENISTPPGASPPEPLRRTSIFMRWSGTKPSCASIMTTG